MFFSGKIYETIPTFNSGLVFKGRRLRKAKRGDLSQYVLAILCGQLTFVRHKNVERVRTTL